MSHVELVLQFDNGGRPDRSQGALLVVETDYLSPGAKVTDRAVHAGRGTLDVADVCEPVDRERLSFL